MTGRWPANVILSPEMAEVLDGQTADLKGGVTVRRNLPDEGKEQNAHGIYGSRKRGASEDFTYGDSGGASRFFLTAGYEPWELDWIYSVGLTPCYGGE